MALEEVVIGHHLDSDFGALQLVETRTEARVSGGPWKPLIYRAWSGRRNDLNATIDISNGDDPPVVTDGVRTAFRSLILNIATFKRTVARGQLALAKDWAERGGLNVALDTDSFSDVLQIHSFLIGENRLTVFMEDTAGIFDKHMLEVRIEQGAIKEICLAG